jgi:hypothetical protein
MTKPQKPFPTWPNSAPDCWMEQLASYPPYRSAMRALCFEGGVGSRLARGPKATGGQCAKAQRRVGITPHLPFYFLRNAGVLTTAHPFTPPRYGEDSVRSAQERCESCFRPLRHRCAIPASPCRGGILALPPRAGEVLLGVRRTPMHPLYFLKNPPFFTPRSPACSNLAPGQSRPVLRPQREALPAIGARQ